MARVLEAGVPLSTNNLEHYDAKAEDSDFTENRPSIAYSGDMYPLILICSK